MMGRTSIQSKEFSKKGPGIDKYIQLDACLDRHIMVHCVILCNDQGVQIAVLMVGPVSIGAVEDNRQRGIGLFEIG